MAMSWSPKWLRITKWLITSAILSFSALSHATPANNPYKNTELYVNPDYVSQMQIFFEQNPEYKEKANKLHLLDETGAWAVSTAIWLDSSQAIMGYPSESRNTHSMLFYLIKAAARASKKPVALTFLIYNLPLRDCNSFSSEGEFKSYKDIEKYKKTYIGNPAIRLAKNTDPTTIVATLQRFYDGTIPNANNVHIIFVVEPDSLPNMLTNAQSTPQCKEAYAHKTYATGISYALTALNTFNIGSRHNIYMYLDIGHSGWLGWKDKANKISSLYNNKTLPGFEYVRGFITNTANYSPTQEGFSYNDYLENGAIKHTKFYAGNDAFDEASYISEIMSIDSNGQLRIDDEHRISAPTSAYYADKHFLIDTSRNGWLLNTVDYKDSMGKLYSRYDQRHHRSNWCNVENIRPMKTPDATFLVPTKITSAGLGVLPTIGPNLVNPLYPASALPMDAFVWIKPPSESDGYYDAAQNLGNQMCGATTGGRHNDNQSTDALQNSDDQVPHAGIPFDNAFKNLIDVAGCINNLFTSRFCEQ